MIMLVMVLSVIATSIGCSKQKDTTDTSGTDNKSNVEADTNKKNEKKTEIVYFTSSAKYKDSYAVIAKKIEEKLPVKIDIQIVPDEQYSTLLKTKLATNEVPDIFDYNTPVAYLNINAIENCLDLSDEPWVERLVNPSLVQTADKKIYSMPRESSSFYPAMYYNKKIFNDLGLEEPTTYDEFLQVLEKIKEAGIVPISMANKENWTTQIFMTSGFSAMLGKDKVEEVYAKLRNNELKHKDVPAFVKILELYQDLYKKGYVNEDHMSTTYDASMDAVGAGKAAMMMNGEWIVSAIKNLHPDSEIGAFAVPLETGLIGSGAFVQGMFIPKASKNIEMTKKVLDLWSQPEQLNIFFAENPAFPAFNDVDSGDVPESVRGIVEDYINTGNYVTQYNQMFPEPSTLNGDYLWKYYQELTMMEKTPLEVLEAWDKDVEDFMKSKKYPGWE